ncbi:Hypothetical protein, putative, partial [Bodo saltans]
VRQNLSFPALNTTLLNFTMLNFSSWLRITSQSTFTNLREIMTTPRTETIGNGGIIDVSIDCATRRCREFPAAASRDFHSFLACVYFFSTRKLCCRFVYAG